MSMTLVQTVTVPSGGASSIEFTGIPQDGTDLLLKVSAQGSVASYQGIYLRFNNDSANNYPWRRLRGDGASATSGSATLSGIELWALTISTQANTFNNIEAYIPNYTSSVAKSVSSDQVTEANALTPYQQLVAGSWTGTSAISSIQLVPYGGTIVQYSSFSLYKVKKA